MKTIVVATDFTASSRNALDYTCQLLGADSGYRIRLIHVYTMPVTYATDGVALASMKDALDSAEDNLADELVWVQQNYPVINVAQRVMTGNGFIETMKEAVKEERADLVVMGANHDYADLWTWDDELLDALTELPVPVMVIPRHISYTPIKNIGFACDYRNLCAPHHISFIKWLAGHTGAQLHVVHVTRGLPESAGNKQHNESKLQELLHDEQPQYHTINDPNIIEAVTGFVKEQQLDFLIVVPHRHDVWYSLFHQSHTRQLARLNHLPVIALHD